MLVPRLLSIFPVAGALVAAAAESPIGRREILQQPPTWFSSAPARALGERIVALQGNEGGWSNWANEQGMTSQDAIQEGNIVHQSLDDGATTTQMRILARLITAEGAPSLPAEQGARFRQSFVRGFEYLLKAQYPNGGWPHRYPAKGYHAHITFNDSTTYNVIVLLKAIAAREPAFAWLDDAQRRRAAAAVDQGIACILACQYVQDGRKTVWGAQHDVTTLQPAPARTFEPASLSGHESVGLVELLMEINSPSPAVIAAVRSAVAWFEKNKVTGIRVERFRSPEGWDARVIKDPSAPPLWGRFYELGTDRVIFSDRDSVIKYSLAEIGRERRGGYGWYTDRPRRLLEVDYPRWARKWSR
jgi:PelA/Pel-15E family pectate lyase